jgi:hypothetical protein
MRGAKSTLDEAVKANAGKEISHATVGDGAVELHFTDGTRISLEDWQQCCEQRYFTCGDNAQDLVGQKLVSMEVESADDAGKDHEVSFLKIQGSESGITVSAHNKHNGYYGGFSIAVTTTKGA